MNARIVRILALALIAGCGGGGGNSSAPPSKFLYVCASGGPNTFPTDIYGLAVYAGGALSPVPGSPAPAANYGGGPVAITHDDKLLFNAALAPFQINPDGSLTAAPSPPFSLPGTPVGLMAHPTADFLYASSSSGVLSVLAINSETGALNLTSSVPLGSNNIIVGNSAVITPDGRHLYQNYVYYPDVIYQFPALLQVAGFSIDSATGALSPVPGSPVSPMTPSTSYPSSTSIGQMAIDPTGKFLYVIYEFQMANVGLDGGVAAFSIDASSGALTPVSGSPFSVGGFPGSAAIDASGKYFIVGLGLLGVTANCLAVLSIDPDTGALAPVPNSPFGPLHQDCGGVAADSSQPIVYAGDTSGVPPATVYALSLDQTTGALAPIGQTAVGDSTKVSVSCIAQTH